MSLAKLSIDEWVDLWDLDRPFAKEGPVSEAALNWRQFLYGWWPLFKFIDMLMWQDYE